jgi:hypothetical protein
MNECGSAGATAPLGVGESIYIAMWRLLKKGQLCGGSHVVGVDSFSLGVVASACRRFGVGDSSSRERASAVLASQSITLFAHAQHQSSTLAASHAHIPSRASSKHTETPKSRRFQNRFLRATHRVESTQSLSRTRAREMLDPEDGKCLYEVSTLERRARAERETREREQTTKENRGEGGHRHRHADPP